MDEKPRRIETMECSECGGRVEWQGPLSALTHTECLHCGALNSQLPESDDFDDDDEGE